MMKSAVLALSLLTFACSVSEVDEDEIPELGEEQDPNDPNAPVGLINCNAQPAFATTGTAMNVGGFPAWAHFTNAADPATKTNITGEVVRLIWATPAGETIHTAIKSISLEEISQALVCAGERGVNVRIVAEGGIGTGEKTKAAKQLEAAEKRLGQDRFRLTYCGAGTDKQWSCIQKGQKAIMHTKLFLFSKTTSPDGAARDNVVWFGSANMTGATGQNSFNNTVTIYGDSALYQGSLQYYRDLQAKKTVPNDDYFGNGGQIVTQSARMFISPSPTKDLWVERLDRVVPGTDCAIVMAQAYILKSRVDVIRKLRNLANNGCTIKVIGAKKDDAEEQEKKFNSEMLDILTGNGTNPKIETRIAKTHDKYVLINARFGDSPNAVRQIVFTGSHNLTGPANNRNDELLVRLDGPDVAAAYFKHFISAWNAGEPAN